MKYITATNEITGEFISLDTNNLTQIVHAWRMASEYEKLAKRIKDKLKPLVAEHTLMGASDAIDGFQFRQSFVQRKTYDKGIMREVLDEDTYDLFMKPDKSAVDKYIRENLESLGEQAKQLRDNMIDDGKAYQVIKLEKLERK